MLIWNLLNPFYYFRQLMSAIILTLYNHLPDIKASGGVEVILEDYVSVSKTYFIENLVKLCLYRNNMIVFLIL